MELLPTLISGSTLSNEGVTFLLLTKTTFDPLSSELVCIMTACHALNQPLQTVLTQLDVLHIITKTFQYIIYMKHIPLVADTTLNLSLQVGHPLHIAAINT